MSKLSSHHFFHMEPLEVSGGVLAWILFLSKGPFSVPKVPCEQGGRITLPKLSHVVVHPYSL